MFSKAIVKFLKRINAVLVDIEILRAIQVKNNLIIDDIFHNSHLKFAVFETFMNNWPYEVR